MKLQGIKKDRRAIETRVSMPWRLGARSLGAEITPFQNQKNPESSDAGKDNNNAFPKIRYFRKFKFGIECVDEYERVDAMNEKDGDRTCQQRNNRRKEPGYHPCSYANAKHLVSSWQYYI